MSLKMTVQIREILSVCGLAKQIREILSYKNHLGQKTVNRGIARMVGRW
jgi:hypothetical protein